jgi:lysophospholipase L1-like esterase
MAGFLRLVLALLAFSARAAAEPGLPPELLAEFRKEWPRNRPIHLVFHGHSVPAGYHKTPEVKPFESYPHLLYQRLKLEFPTALINIIVTAKGGEHSIDGAARFEREVLVHQPDVIFIDYGLNDRRQAPEAVETAWRSMIQAARERKIPLVLLTPTGDLSADLANPEDSLHQRATLIRRIADRENVPLADVSTAWQAELAKPTPHIKLLSQGNHPNLRGHQLVEGVLSRLFIK